MENHRSIAQRYMTESIGLVRRSGYQMSLNFDMAGWAALMRSAPKITIVSPTFDPEQSDLRPGEAFWLQVCDELGAAACIADRLLVTDDFVRSEVATGRIWYARPTEEDRPGLSDTVPVGRFGGRVGHAGGLWVHPRRRKDGLSWLLPRFMRALSIFYWDVDRHCGMAFAGLHDSGLSARAYGFPESHVMIEGHYPPMKADARVFLLHIDRDQIVSQFEDDLARMTDGEPTLHDVATIVTNQVQKPAPSVAVAQAGAIRS